MNPWTTVIRMMLILFMVDKHVQVKDIKRYIKKTECALQ